MGNMANMAGRNVLTDSQRQVPILTSVIAFAQAGNLFLDARSIHNQMAQKILRQKKIRIPIGFEVRFIAATLFIDLIFVAVD
jgi:hypothetical protein